MNRVFEYLILTPTGQPSARSKSGFRNYFAILIELAIVFAAILWVAYGYLPRQYYLPISLLTIVVIGFASYFILDKKMAI